MPNSFEKIAPERLAAEETHGNAWASDPGAKNPGDLTAKEKVSSQPGEKDGIRSRRCARQVAQELPESPIAHDSGKSN